MLENLMVVIVIITILWLGGFAAYLYANRQQQDLDSQIEVLKQRLDREGGNGKG